MASGRSRRAAARRARTRVAWAAAILVLAGVSATATPEHPARAVRLLEIDGIVSPFAARYLERELSGAHRRGDAAVLVQLDTPGGLLDSTRSMTEAMLTSRVPVVVYVAPSGARAASAGMFLLIAANVGAMAPGTHVGAAHPVQVGGGGGGDAVMSEKVVNDAAAMARSIATVRKRNAAWAERAVRESVSATAAEAHEQGVIDLVAPDLDALLRALDGRKVVTAAGEVRLATAGAPLVRSNMSLPERILQLVVHPNVAYVLFTIGLIGIAAELYSPGLFFPGIAGVISLLLAFAAFGVLPLNWAGIALVAGGIALVALDLFTEGIGILAAGGVMAFVSGSLLLYSPSDPASPARTDLRISWWLVGIMAAAILGFFVLIGRALLRARHAPVATGPEAIVGRAGIARSDLAPAGTVSVGAEVWSAVADDGPIRRGERIRVLGVEGVQLHVARADAGA